MNKEVNVGYGLKSASSRAWKYRVLASVSIATIVATGALAAPTQQEFHFAAQNLETALSQYAEQTNVQLLVAHELVADHKSRKLSGKLTQDQALGILLEGSGLTYTYTDKDTIVIKKKAKLDEHSSMNAGPSNGVRLAQATSVAYQNQTDNAAPVAVSSDAPARADDATKVAQVEEVVVIGAKRKFAPEDSNAATKINMAVIDTPQSLSVLSSEFMNIAGVTTINAAAAFTPGVISPEGDTDNYFGIVARGFASNYFNGTKIDGMSFSDEGGPIDLGIADRFEVVRGPASIIYGQSDYGATLNVQLKKPKAKRAVEGELGGDINGSYRALVDITGALTKDERLRGRLIVIYDNHHTPQHLAFSKSATIAPSLSFDVTENTKLDLNYFHTSRDLRFNQGFALMQNSVTGEVSLPQVPRNAFLSADFNIANSATDYGVAKLTHNFGDAWVLAATGNWYHTSNPRINTLIVGPIPESGIVGLHDAHENRQAYDWSGDLTLTGDFEALGKTHTLMLSGYYRSFNENFFSACCASIGTMNVLDPVSTGYSPFYTNFPVDPENSPQSSDIGFSQHTTTKDWAFSGLLLLHPVDRLSVMLGLRYNEFKRTDVDFYDRSISWQTPDFYKDHAVTHRVGLVYEVVNNVNIYGSYSDGVIFQPSLTASGGTLPPETGIQWEFGAKAALLDKKLTVSAAAFQIKRNNVAAPDPDHINEPFSIAINGQTHKGIELEAVGEPIPGWNIISSYSYLDVLIKDAPDPAMIGHQRNGAPHHMLKLYTTYQLLNGPLQGVSLGGGIFHTSARESDDYGTFKLPAYTRFDLRLGYDALENVSFSVNATNITNTKIYSTIGYGLYTGIDYQSRRTVFFGMKFKY